MMSSDEQRAPSSGPWTARRVAGRVWALLMTPVGERVPVRRRGGKRGAPHGVALMSVLIGLALMAAVVTDLGANEMVRYKLAAHDRDVMKAQALAESGANMSRLILAAQAAIQPQLQPIIEMGIPLPAQTVWELIPLDSSILKGLTDGSLQGMFGLDVSDVLAEREQKLAEQAEDDAAELEKDPEASGKKPFRKPAGGFGAFDGGFSVQIEDEERKAATLRGWAGSNDRFAFAQRLYSVFQSERYDFLFEERDSYGNRVDRHELVANIYDYLDTNEDATDPRAEPSAWGRLGSGAEDGYYTSYRDRVQPRNEYFDSTGELRLVHGMSDAHMKAFADAITIYGESKVNILSATPISVEALVRMCAVNPSDPLLFDPFWMQQTVQGWMSCKQLGMLVPEGCKASPEGFVQYLQSGLSTNGTALAVDKDRCLGNISTESKNFTVKSTARVGDVARTITLVVRVHGSSEERYYYSIVGQ